MAKSVNGEKSGKMIFLNNIPVTYYLERKAVKNVNLRIKEDGTLHISASSKVSVAFIEAFIQRKSAVILSHIAHLEAIPVPEKIEYADGEEFFITGKSYILKLVGGEKEKAEIVGEEIILTITTDSTFESKKKVMRSFLGKIYDNILMDSCRRIYPEFHYLKIKFPKITVRGMKTRWGSCNPYKEHISLNRGLAKAPIECVDYVVYHEFTHYIHQDHSPQYYRALEKHCPNWKELRARLNSGNYLREG